MSEFRFDMHGFVQNPDDLHNTAIHKPVEHQMVANEEVEIAGIYLVTGQANGWMISYAIKCAFHHGQVRISLLASLHLLRVPGDFPEIVPGFNRNPDICHQAEP